MNGTVIQHNETWKEWSNVSESNKDLYIITYHKHLKNIWMVQHFVMEPVRGSRRWARRRVGGRAPWRGRRRGRAYGLCNKTEKGRGKDLYEKHFYGAERKKGVMGEMLRNLKIAQMKLTCTLKLKCWGKFHKAAHANKFIPSANQSIH